MEASNNSFCFAFCSADNFTFLSAAFAFSISFFAAFTAARISALAFSSFTVLLAYATADSLITPASSRDFSNNEAGFVVSFAFSSFSAAVKMFSNASRTFVTSVVLAETSSEDFASANTSFALFKTSAAFTTSSC